jgi:hypothetical protein
MRCTANFPVCMARVHDVSTCTCVPQPRVDPRRLEEAVVELVRLVGREDFDRAAFPALAEVCSKRRARR